MRPILGQLWPIIALAGCAHAPEQITIREPIEVRVPVPIGCRVPPELLAPLEYPLPVFVGACAPATSGLTAEGETELQRLLWITRQRLTAWEAWAEACGE